MNNIEALLDTVNFFRSIEEIDKKQLSILLNLAKMKQLYQTDILIQQGTKPTDLFFLLEGQLGAYIYDNATKKNIQVGTIRRGEMIGDLSLALDEQRLATVRVITPKARVIGFRIEAFRNRHRYPELKDEVYFLFWRDLIQSLKWRIDMFEIKYSNSAKIVAIADQARTIRRDVPSVHAFTFEPSFTLEIISDLATQMGTLLNSCNRLVAKHRAQELE